jgi:large subunit ribosomal protein L3
MTASIASERVVKALLGTKLGMTQVWDDAGRLRPVTVIEVGTNVVTQVKSPENDGYSSVQLGYGQIDPRKLTQPLRARFDAAGLTPRRHLAEVRTSDAAEYSVGQELTAETFEVGTTVDVVGTTKGKGTAGVMKRHGFHGVGASHGAHRNHRKPGSIGGASTPSRVFKGMKMAGRMGHDRQTTQNLTIHGVDVSKGLLLVAGAVPGPKGGIVVIKTAAKGA